MEKKVFGIIISIVMAISFCIVNVEAASDIILEVNTYGNFETAGVDIKVNKEDIKTSVFQVEYKVATDSVYRKGHNFVKYDGNHMATSLFNLSLDTTYDIRIIVDGTVEETATVKTKPEFVMPTGTNQKTVNNSNELLSAISTAVAGDEILINPSGKYELGGLDRFSMYNRKGTESRPIIIRSAFNGLKAKIENGVEVVNSSYIVFKDIEINTEDDQGMRIDDCSNITVFSCYIHDNKSVNSDSNILIRDFNKTVKECNHLFLNNIISDEVNEGSPEKYFEASIGQTYYGINTSGHLGGMITIRGNEFYGLVDGVHTGALEKVSGDSFNTDLDKDDFLKMWPGQNIDVYDNVFYNCADDCIETDGHMVNGRFFRNRLGNSNVSISIAANFPGPNFFIYNYMSGAYANNIKINTGGEEVTRGAFFYHNTIVQPTYGQYCFVRHSPTFHTNLTFKNNIFYAQKRIFDTNITKDDSSTNTCSDYNLLYTENAGGNTVFSKVYLGNGNGVNVSSFSEYKSRAKTAITGTYIDALEENSINANPKLDLNTLYRDYEKDTRNSILMLTFENDSPAIDSAVLIPGINDLYVGDGPDIGAYEFDPEFTPTPVPTVTLKPTAVPTITSTPTPIPVVTPTPASIVKVEKPVKLKGLKVVSKKKGIVSVKWKRTKNAKGYEIYRSTKKNTGFKRVKTFKSEDNIKFNDRKVRGNKVYYYRGRAYNLSGNKKIYGAYSSVRKVKVRK